MLIPSFTLLSFTHMDMASWRNYRYPDRAEDIKITDDSRKEYSFYIIYAMRGLIEVHDCNDWLSNLDLYFFTEA